MRIHLSELNKDNWLETANYQFKSSKRISFLFQIFIGSE